MYIVAKIATNKRSLHRERLLLLTIEIMETLCYNSCEIYPIVKWGMIVKFKFKTRKESIPMNMFKNNGGFTLVELIVVIAILAILAGVAVPVYSGYITKANEASDMTQLDSLKTAALFSVMEKHPSATVEEIVYNGTAVNVKFTCSDTSCANATQHSTDAVAFTDAVEDLMGGDLPEFKSDKNTATWTSTSAKWELSKATASTGTDNGTNNDAGSDADDDAE